MLLMTSEPAVSVQVGSNMLTCLLFQPSTTSDYSHTVSLLFIPHLSAGGVLSSTLSVSGV